MSEVTNDYENITHLSAKDKKIKSVRVSVHINNSVYIPTINWSDNAVKYEDVLGLRPIEENSFRNIIQIFECI